MRDCAIECAQILNKIGKCESRVVGEKGLSLKSIMGEVFYFRCKGICMNENNILHYK